MQEYIEASSSLTAGRYPFVEILATVLGAPILEEIVFRGLIYGNFKMVMPTWVRAAGAGGALWPGARSAPVGRVHLPARARPGPEWTTTLAAFGPAFCCICASTQGNYLPLLFELDLTGMVVLCLAALLVVAIVFLVLVLYRRQGERPRPAN